MSFDGKVNRTLTPIYSSLLLIKSVTLLQDVDIELFLIELVEIIFQSCNCNCILNAFLWYVRVKKGTNYTTYQNAHASFSVCERNLDYLAGDGEGLFLPRGGFVGDGPLLFSLSAECLRWRRKYLICGV